MEDANDAATLNSDDEMSAYGVPETGPTMDEEEDALTSALNFDDEQAIAHLPKVDIVKEVTSEERSPSCFLAMKVTRVFDATPVSMHKEPRQLVPRPSGSEHWVLAISIPKTSIQPGPETRINSIAMPLQWREG